MKDDQRAECWLKRAAELRAEARAMLSPDARASLMKLAADWEHMGLKARRRAEGAAQSPPRPSHVKPGWDEIPMENRGPDEPRKH